MFAVLAYNSDSDTEADIEEAEARGDEKREQDENKEEVLPLPQQVQRLYSLVLGKQAIRFDTADPIPYNLDPDNSLLHGSSINSVSFYGRCFQCQYVAHSQKYCPLRQCQTCKKYGHSEIVCISSKKKIINTELPPPPPPPTDTL